MKTIIINRFECHRRFHCTIYAVGDPTSRLDKFSFKPFTSADQMVAMTGKSVEQWLKEHPAKRVAQQKQKAKVQKVKQVSLLEQLMA